MTLDIGILLSEKPLDFDPEGAISFDDDGYFWFLYPIFQEIYTKTGEMIDLYEVTIFKGDNLLLLQEAIEKGLNLVENQPLEWDVHIGTQYYPIQQELYSTVVKQDFLNLLHTFQKLVRRAINNGETLICYGD
jgi:hypothetical protein